MRKFSSYGPPNNKLHYYAPRETLITNAIMQLKGELPDEGGHYMTIWAPRQTGKTWIMREVFLKLQQETQFDVVILGLQFLDGVTDVNRVAQLNKKVGRRSNQMWLNVFGLNFKGSQDSLVGLENC